MVGITYIQDITCIVDVIDIRYSTEITEFIVGMFFFIPRTSNVNTSNDNIENSWNVLTALDRTLNNIDDFIIFLESKDYIMNDDYKNKVKTINYDTYTINKTLYDDFDGRKKTYNEYLENLSNYSIDKYIHAYTFGTLQYINAKNDQGKPGIVTTIYNTDNYVEGFIEGASQSSSDVKYTFRKFSGGGELILDPPTAAEEVRMQNVAEGAIENAQMQAETNVSNEINNINKQQKNILPICINTVPDGVRKVKKILSSLYKKKYKNKESFIEGNTTDYLINKKSAVQAGIQAGTSTIYYEFSTTDIYQLTDKLYEVTDISCANYTINATCTTDKYNIDRAKCEVCKNFAYRDWYDANNAKNIRYFANHDDSKQEYSRTWIKTCNLGIAILLLSIGIYYQSN